MYHMPNDEVTYHLLSNDYASVNCSRQLMHETARFLIRSWAGRLAKFIGCCSLMTGLVNKNKRGNGCKVSVCV